MKRSHKQSSAKRDLIGFGLITISFLLISVIIFLTSDLIGETSVGKSTGIIPASCTGESLDLGELCDGLNVGTETCSIYNYTEGQVGCCKDCRGFNLSSCMNQMHSCIDYDNGTEYFIASSIFILYSKKDFFVLFCKVFLS